MKKVETPTRDTHTLTTDFSLDLTWSDPECHHEPSTTEIARENFASMIDLVNPHNIVSSHDYLFYLGHIVDEDIHNNKPTPHKALFQLIGTNYGITEPTTRIVPANDLPTAFHYGLHLLENHEVIWMGTGSIDDHSDPGGCQNLNPPLHKNIRTREDLLDALEKASAFELAHPGSYLKIFPQDKEKPAIGSMVFTSNKHEGNLIHLKVRKGEYTTSERKAGDDRPILISIDLSGPIVKVITNQPTHETQYWLNIILNSRELFQKLDDAGLRGSNYINPEFLVFMNGLNTKISFFTDCIWGSKKESQKNYRCPKTNPLLNKLSSAMVNEQILFVPEKYSQGLMEYSDYQFAVLNTLKSARSKNPDQQTAEFILRSQELSRKLYTPFNIPKLDQVTLNTLWRISHGYPIDTTINTIEYMQNQLSIAELPNPNVNYSRLSSRFDRYLKRTLPIWLYKLAKQIVKKPTVEHELLRIFNVYKISKKDAYRLIKAMNSRTANK